VRVEHTDDIAKMPSAGFEDLRRAVTFCGVNQLGRSGRMAKIAQTADRIGLLAPCPSRIMRDSFKSPTEVLPHTVKGS
jgi:hypothetical protein